MAKGIEISSKTKEELQNFVVNYRKQGLTSHPIYLAALEELETRKGNKLNFEKSCRIILDAARERRF